MPGVSSEAALISAARNGSTKAFADLVRAHREGLLRYLVARSANFADAEDALQDTLINAYRYLNSYDSQWRFSTWLYRIAINNLARQRPMNSVAVTDFGDESGDPLVLCMAESDRDNLWIAARRLLNDEVYTAMWLRYAEDMSVKDIAAVLDRSVSWTKVNLLRGRKILDADINNDATDKQSEAYG